MGSPTSASTSPTLSSFKCLPKCTNSCGCMSNRWFCSTCLKYHVPPRVGVKIWQQFSYDLLAKQGKVSLFVRCVEQIYRRLRQIVCSGEQDFGCGAGRRMVPFSPNPITSTEDSQLLATDTDRFKLVTFHLHPKYNFSILLVAILRESVRSAETSASQSGTNSRDEFRGEVLHKNSGTYVASFAREAAVRCQHGGIY